MHPADREKFPKKHPGRGSGGNFDGPADVITPTMNPRTPLYAAGLATTIFFSGCVDTGPNTQRGAMGGAALGAIAGAIIGNNSGSGNGASGAAIGAIAGAIAGGTLGNAQDHEQGTIYHSEGEATTNVYAEQPPFLPPSRNEVVVMQPYPEAVWIGGYWAYTGRGSYTWVEGHWVRPPARYHTYVPPHWKRHRGGYIYVQGYWRG